jgi:hypothetical protein
MRGHTTSSSKHASKSGVIEVIFELGAETSLLVRSTHRATASTLFPEVVLRKTI